MAEPSRNLLSWDDYVTWEATQPVRHDLVGGEVHAMGGGTRQHDSVCNNLRALLWTQLRGRPCRSHGPDLKVQTGTGNGRYPDALIDCGKRASDALQAEEPVAVFEVLSRSTSWKDQNEKFDDYDATPTIQHYVLVFQDQMRVMAYGRDDRGRLDRGNATVLRDPGESILIANLDVLLPLPGLYEGTGLETGQPQSGSNPSM